jgi:hypothetical protein
MTGMTVVDDHNQDDMSRKAGCYMSIRGFGSPMM